MNFQVKVCSFILAVCLVAALLTNLKTIAFAAEKELLVNGGFEKGLDPWKVYEEGELAIETSKVNSGSSSVLISGRKNQWNSPTQEITKQLQDNGPGRYTMSVHARTASGQAKLLVVINFKDDSGSRWVSSAGTAIHDQGFTKISVTKNITWKGALQFATIYVQNEDKNLVDLYLDDFSFVKPADQTGPQLPPADIKLRNDKTLVGAIRWDAWVGDLSTGKTAPEDFVGHQVEKALGPEKYHYRLPWFAKIIDNQTVKINGATQDVIDREIRYAKAAGIDYWAFCYYEGGMATQRKLYLSSMERNGMKWNYIFGGPINANELNNVINDLKNPLYLTTTDGRPVVYFFPGSQVALSKQLLEATKAAGIAKPYFISMGGSSMGGEELMATGSEGLSAYTVGGSNGVPYDNIIKDSLTLYNTQKTTGAQIVPVVSTGWDKRPRHDNPVSWEKAGAAGFATAWVQQPTPEQIGQNLQQALDWNKNNKESTVFNSVLIYAWNEHDEGGWINPTLFELRDSGRPLRLDAIKKVLINDRVKYTDLEVVSWAQDAVNGLAVSDVFKGVNGTSFEPSKQITRAQFLGWLVRTLGVASDHTTDHFSDVASDNLYNKEIAIAKALKLTTGVGDNRFNPDGLITRQDMMVLTNRALSTLGMVKNSESVSNTILDNFGDRIDIADYAKKSVAVLVNEGFIKGYDGNMNPTGNATRAEAAVLLDRILNK